MRLSGFNNLVFCLIFFALNYSSNVGILNLNVTAAIICISAHVFFHAILVVHLLIKHFHVISLLVHSFFRDSIWVTAMAPMTSLRDGSLIKWRQMSCIDHAGRCFSLTTLMTSLITTNCSSWASFLTLIWLLT